ncbi:uncharacterized protein TrAtP1_009456 [Trichoderma atroviride]|uniref:uncharacterized protein n=1 Tax=Hypocrea atroviridis TaxID=63577 RepID=UPI0033278EB7|nr:hypothetical protein TrAtP1_009456 [Trichoderma atroviride]
MATMADPPVFRELAKIQKDIGLPPGLKLSDYGQCRSYVQNTTEPCSKTACSIAKRDELDVLLFEFRHMTDHRRGANKAFTRWKAQYIATAPNLVKGGIHGEAISEALGDVLGNDL